MGIAQIMGSAIYNLAQSDTGLAGISVHQTDISYNTASGFGAICNQADGGTALAYVYGSKINNNTAEKGGGIFSQAIADGIAAMTLKNSKIIKNLAKKDGGGVWSDGTLTVEKSSILNNKADVDKEDQDTGHGGGIYYVTGKEPILLGVNNISHNTPDDLYEGKGP